MPLSPVTPPTTRDRLGGSAAGSWQLLAIICAGVTFVQALSLVRVDVTVFVQPEHFDAVGILLQCGAIIGVYAVARVTVLRHRATQPVSVVVAAAVATVAGAARLGAVLALAGGVSPTYTPVEAVVAAASVTAISTLVALAITYLLATRAWYIETRRRLIQLDVELEAQRLRAIGATDALETLVIASAQSTLDGASAPARKALDRAEAAPEDAAAALLDAARSGIRPAARTLTEPATDTAGYPRISVSWAIVREFRRHPLPALVPALAFGVILPSRLVAISDLATSLLMTALTVAVTVGIFRLGRALIARWPLTAVPTTIAACAIAVLPLWIWFRALDSVVSPGRSAILAGAFLLVVTVVVSLIQTIEDSGEAVLEALRRPLAQSDLERLAAERAREQLEREIGMHLHSGVQPQLVAASYAIQDAVERGDRQALEEAIASARAALDRRLEPAARLTATDVRSTVEAKWAGLIAVRWEPDVLPRAAQTEEVADVIRECLANALVHGHADTATIAVAEDDGTIEIRVADNGRGPQGGHPGLGSAVLHQATGGNWTIAPAPTGGSVVVARLPRSAAPDAD